MGLLKRAARAWKLAGQADSPPAQPARKEPTLTRSFKMARQTRLNNSWTGRSNAGDADHVIYKDHETLRQRAREQSINSGYAKRFYRLLRQNVIGPHGITMRSKALKADGYADDEMRRVIEQEFKKWSKRGNCDVTGRYSFVTFMWLWIDTLARDGEVMVRILRNWPNRWGFALQIIESDLLDTTLNTWLSNGNRVRMGVEIDEWEKPIAYWLKRSHPGDNFERPAEQEYQRIPADELRLTFDPWRPHQSRGFTWTHAGANDLHHVEEYAGAELIAAEQGAKMTGFYEQDAEWVDPPGDEDSDDADQGVIIEEIEAGSARLLPYGVTFKPYDNKHPSTNFAPFTKAAVRRIAGAFGPSYNRLAHDLEGVSFSSLRSGEIDERDFYKCIQQFAISELLEWVGEVWMECSMLKGVLKIPPRAWDRLAPIEWLPRGWDWVDPKKDSDAAKTGIETLTDSVSDIMRRKGRDPDDVYNQISEDIRRFERLGLPNPYAKALQANGVTHVEPDEEDDDEPNATGTD